MAPKWIDGCNSLEGLCLCHKALEHFMNSNRALRVNYCPAFTPRTSVVVVVQYRIHRFFKIN